MDHHFQYVSTPRNSEGSRSSRLSVSYLPEVSRKVDNEGKQLRQLRMDLNRLLESEQKTPTNRQRTSSIHSSRSSYRCQSHSSKKNHFSNQCEGSVELTVVNGAKTIELSLKGLSASQLYRLISSMNLHRISPLKQRLA